HAGKSSRRVVSAFMTTAFAQDSAEAAKAQWRRVADQLRPKLPKLAAFMDEAESDVLAYMSFPAEHSSKLHSTNGLERLNGEIKGGRSSLSLCRLSRLRRPSLMRRIGRTPAQQTDVFRC